MDWVPFKGGFTNAFRALQINQAKEDCPQMSPKVFVFLAYLKALLKDSPLGKHSWQEDYLRLPYSCSFLSNIIYSPFTLVPSPTSGVILPCNLPFVIFLFHAAVWMVCCSVSPAQRCGNAKRPRFFSEAFISVIKHWLEELDNLIIDLWWKVVSSGPSAVNDSLFCTFHLHFHFKNTSALEEKKMLWQR